MTKKLTKATPKTTKIFGENAIEVTTRTDGGWTVTDAIFKVKNAKFWAGTSRSGVVYDVDYRISVAVYKDKDGTGGQDTTVTGGRNYGLSYWDATNVIHLEIPPAHSQLAIDFIWKMIREGKI